jgi:hypothetical protein
MEDSVQSKVVQRNAEIMEETMMKGRSRQAEASLKERDKKDDLTRTRSKNPMLVEDLPISKSLSWIRPSLTKSHN